MEPGKYYMIEMFKQKRLFLCHSINECEATTEICCDDGTGMGSFFKWDELTTEMATEYTPDEFLTLYLLDS